MEFFKADSNVNFLGLRKFSAILSMLMFVASIVALVVNGLNLGLDFTGGVQIEVHYSQAADLKTMREQLHQHGFPDARLQVFGSAENVLIRIAQHQNDEQNSLEKRLATVLPKAKIERVEFIGPQVGSELASNGALAVVVSLLITMMYIAWRFEYRLAISAAVALIHDPIITLGIFAAFQLTFDLKVLAAVLAIIGYSLNDTIVVFDRIRENFRKIRRASPVDIVNASINQTLSRTIITSALTLMVVLSLFIYGGPFIREFSLALIIGIVVGTYSSIYVASALAVALGLSKENLMPTPKAEVDARP